MKCYDCERHGHKWFNCNYGKFPNKRPVTATEKQQTPLKHTYPSDHQRGSYNTSCDGNYGYQDVAEVVKDPRVSKNMETYRVLVIQWLSVKLICQL